MAYWLVKSEPFKYSWDQFIKDKKAVWDGVRNYAARNNLRSMKIGDQVLWYHSNEGLEIVGIAEVIKESYQDPTTEETAWLVVDLTPVRKLKKPVSLAQLKADSRLANMDIIRLGRLSVQTVKEEEWGIVMGMAGRNLKICQSRDENVEMWKFQDIIELIVKFTI
ncbi:MAG: EVE domain-containing protein [Chitinophagaceae bacterium]|nr:EVE domain-containing protein [Chitinophagaceae bacterium]